MDILNIAAFLNHHFKSLSFLVEVDKVSTCLTVQEKTCNLLLDLDSVSDHPSGPGNSESTNSSEVNIVSSESSDVTPTAKHKRQSKFMKLLSDVISSAATSSANKTCEEKAKLELQWYMNDSSCDSIVNPLRRWYESKP